MKKDLNEIDTSTDEGKLLLAALAHITCTTRTNKTPNEVLIELAGKAEEVFEKGEKTNDKK